MGGFFDYLRMMMGWKAERVGAAGGGDDSDLPSPRRRYRREPQLPLRKKRRNEPALLAAAEMIWDAEYD